MDTSPIAEGSKTGGHSFRIRSSAQHTIGDDAQIILQDVAWDVRLQKNLRETDRLGLVFLEWSRLRRGSHGGIQDSDGYRQGK